MNKPLSALLAISLFAPASLAFAASPAEKAAAQSLFDDGKALMQKNQFAAACPKFEESIKIDPAPGAILNLAVCDEGLGKTATAWLLFNQSISLARKPPIRKDREELAQQHLAKIEPLLSKITVNVASADSSLDGFVVKLDGEPLGAATWGAEVPVDPGAHHLEASAPGHVAFTIDFTVAKEKDRRTVDVPALDVDGSQPPPATVPPKPVESPSIVPAPAPLPPASDVHVERRDGSAQKTWGIVAGSVGVTALGFALFEGLHAHSEKNAMNAEADPAARHDDYQSAKNAVTFGRIGLGVGLVGLGAGAWLYFTAPRSSDVAEVRVVPSVGGAMIVGAF